MQPAPIEAQRSRHSRCRTSGRRARRYGTEWARARCAGLYDIGALLFMLGLFPLLGAMLQQIPKPVLGGAPLIMFGSLAAAGIRILSRVKLERRNMLIIAAQPELLHQMPTLVRHLFESAITCGGVTAILLDLLLPRDKTADAAASVSLQEPQGT